MSTQVEAMMQESGLDQFESDELAAFLAMLGSLVPASEPVPSPALARLLAGSATSSDSAVVPLLARRHQNAFAAALLAVTGIVATGVAAAANELPPAAQRIVAEFADRFLLFDFPYPEERSENLAGDPDGSGGPAVGADDGESPGHDSAVRDSADRGDSGDERGEVTPEPEIRDGESVTQVIASGGDENESDDSSPPEHLDLDDNDGDDSDDSSNGETGDQTEDTNPTTTDEADGDGDGDGEGTETSSESGGDDMTYEDDPPDSSEAIDDQRDSSADI